MAVLGAAGVRGSANVRRTQPGVRRVIPTAEGRAEAGGVGRVVEAPAAAVHAISCQVPAPIAPGTGGPSGLQRRHLSSVIAGVIACVSAVHKIPLFFVCPRLRALVGSAANSSECVLALMSDSVCEELAAAHFTCTKR